MLEMPRRSGAKILSHMLMAHGGEIFLHTLSTRASSSAAPEDPPSISEGPGGRITDYRIPDLGEMMRANRLAPWFTADGRGLRRAAERVARHALFCPLTIGSTTIFNMAALENLQKIMVQEEVGEEELAECRKAIYTLLAMENKGEVVNVVRSHHYFLPTKKYIGVFFFFFQVLPVPVQTTAAGKTKSMKKDEQYRIMFAELERFLASHARTEKHTKVRERDPRVFASGEGLLMSVFSVDPLKKQKKKKVLECLLEVRNKQLTEKPVKPPASSSSSSKTVEVEVALREMDRYNSMTERERSDFNLSGDGVLRSTTESPMSPTSSSPTAAAAAAATAAAAAASNAKKGGNALGGPAGGKAPSLLDLWTRKIEKENSKKHVPFHGLRNLGEKAKLYLSMEKLKEAEMITDM